jgi:hypothetical protein
MKETLINKILNYLTDIWHNDLNVHESIHKFFRISNEDYRKWAVKPSYKFKFRVKVKIILRGFVVFLASKLKEK